LTTNYVAKAIAGNTLGDSVIYDNGTNVGIGTTSPATTLNVSGSTRISAGELQIEGNNAALRLYRTSGINYFDWASGQNLYFGTVTSIGGAGRVNKMVLLNDGNLGIGTNAPVQRLDLSGSLRIRSAGTYSDPTDNAGFLNYDSTGGIFTISARSNGGSTFMAFRTSNSGTAGERMRIINDGNVGIGSSSPAYKLDVNGNANFTNGFYTNTDASSTSYFVGANGTRPIIFQNNTGASYDFGFKFYDSNTLSIVGGNTLANPTTDLVVFKYDGNVGIGTTSPGAKLDVSGVLVLV